MRYLSKILAFSSVLFLFACETEETDPCDGSLAVSVSNIQDATCFEDTGAITVAATGGDGTYTFSLDGGSFTSNTGFDGVSSGSHSIMVKDGNNCESEVVTTVPSGVLLADIQPIIENQCAVSGCHDGSNNRPAFTTNAGIMAQASNIGARVGNGTMPPASSSQSLTDEESATIICWVSDGGN